MIPAGMRWLVAAAAFVALVVLGSILYDRFRDRDRDAWEQERAVLIARGDSLEARLDRTAAERDSARAVADSAIAASEHEHARAEAAADALALQATVTDSLLRSLPADSIYTPIIARLTHERDEYQRLYETESAAYRTLHTSTMALRAQLTAVEGELLEARAQIGALTELVENAPGERAWWVPRIVVGYGGVLANGDVHHGPSLTIGLTVGA